MSFSSNFSLDDILNAIKIQSVFRMYRIKKIIKDVIDIEEFSQIEQEIMYSVGDKILVDNGRNLVRRIIIAVNNITECVSVANDPNIYSFSVIRPCYFDDEYMNMKCSKPCKLYKIKQGKGSFYGIKNSFDESGAQIYYIQITLDKQMYFGPYMDMNHALLYHDWIKLKWLIDTNKWLKNSKKQYTNFGYIVTLIEKGAANKKTISMFNEFKNYFNSRLDLSIPDNKPKKFIKEKIIKEKKEKKSRKRKKTPKINKIGKSDMVKCFVKQTPNRSRKTQLSLNGHKEVLKIQDGKCALCHEKIIVDEWKWEIDHCIPWCFNGGHCIPNFQAVHKKCHDIKSKYIDKKFKEFSYYYVNYYDAKAYCKALFDNHMEEIGKKQKEFLNSYRSDY